MTTSLTEVLNKSQPQLSEAIAKAKATYEAPKRRPLFEIVADIDAALEISDGEVTDDVAIALDAIEGELADKAEAYNVVIKKHLAKAEAYKKVQDQFAAGMARETRKANGLKARLLSAMQSLGVCKLEAQTCTVTIKVSHHVEVTDEDRFLTEAEERFIRRAAETVNKAELLKALKAGEQVPLAELVKTESLVFR